jgi:hypothetical protein
MRDASKTLFLFFALSCTGSKTGTHSTESKSGKFKSPLSLPVCFSFEANLPHDSIIQSVTTYFNDKNIQVISKDKMFDLIQIQARNVYQNTNITPGSNPESMLGQIERKTNYVINLLRIEFSFIDITSKTFKLKWYNELMPNETYNLYKK